MYCYLAPWRRTVRYCFWWRVFACLFVCSFVRLLTNSRGKACSCRRETFRIDWFRGRHAVNYSTKLEQNPDRRAKKEAEKDWWRHLASVNKMRGARFAVPVTTLCVFKMFLQVILTWAFIDKPCINPLMGTSTHPCLFQTEVRIHAATSIKMMLVHWSLMGGLLHLVQQGGAWAGPAARQGPSLLYQM